MRHQWRVDIHIKVSPLLTHILLFHWTSVAKPKLRDKMKNFRMVTAEYYTKHGTLPSCGSLRKWWALLVTQTVKNLPAMQKTWLQSLGQKDPLEEEMATHSSILAWEIPWTEESGRQQTKGLQRVGHDWATNTDVTFMRPALLVRLAIV